MTHPEIKTIKFTGDNADECAKFCGGEMVITKMFGIIILVPNALWPCKVGEYILRHKVKGKVHYSVSYAEAMD